MIVLEDLKPILEPLIDGREDAAELIEAIAALDKPVETDRAVIDEEIAKVNAEWNERYKAAFFGSKAANLDGQPKDYSDPEPEEDEVTGDNITIEDLFEEKIID